jgi:hypothetical protein
MKTDQSRIAVNDYEVDGVEALLSVNRISDGSLTVKWEYRNETNAPKRPGESFDGMGSTEAYSLVWHAYLAVPATRPNIQWPRISEALRLAAATVRVKSSY